MIQDLENEFKKLFCEAQNKLSNEQFHEWLCYSYGSLTCCLDSSTHSKISLKVMTQHLHFLTET